MFTDIMAGVLLGTKILIVQMSYNNYLDGDAAYSAVCDFAEPTCVIVKHTNPCGVASRGDLKEAYRKAVEADPISAFGGIVAFNRSIHHAFPYCPPSSFLIEPFCFWFAHCLWSFRKPSLHIRFPIFAIETVKTPMQALESSYTENYSTQEVWWHIHVCLLVWAVASSYWVNRYWMEDLGWETWDPFCPGP